LFFVVAFSPRSGLAVNLRFTHSQPASVAKYRAYYGSDSRAYDGWLDLGPRAGSPGAVMTISFPVTLPSGAPLYVALTALDSAGRESGLSNEIVLLQPGVRGPDDAVADDGDGSGIPGDSTCTGGQTQGCDDNCPYLPNGPSFGSCIAGDSARRGKPCLADGDCGVAGYCSQDQEDSDRDGIGDACEQCGGFDCAACALSAVDADGDGIGDACDVCPAAWDAQQLDSDRDGRGDACDSTPNGGSTGGGSTGGGSTGGGSNGGGSSGGGTPSRYDQVRAERERERQERIRAKEERAEQLREQRQQTLCERYGRC
jgi:hypothetical protein